MKFPDTDHVPLYLQFSDHVGSSMPPVLVLRALYSLLPEGTEQIEFGFGQMSKGEMEVRWQLFALVGERLVIVDATAPVEDWTSNTPDIPHELESWLVPVTAIASLGVAAVTSHGRGQDSGQWVASYALRMPWAEYQIPQGEISSHPLVKEQLEAFTRALVKAMYA